MKRKVILIALIVLAFGTIVVGVLLSKKNHELEASKIKILDATYACSDTYEKFYEDSEFIYYFICSKSDSVFVKLPNGNKMLVVDALDDNKITIDELINTELNIYKERK